MAAPDKHPPIEGGLIESVALVDKLTRTSVGRYVGTTLPGHLLHVVTEGEVHQEIGGRHYRLTPGMAVWYHEDETVYGQILQVPWTFYTASFRARRLAPPPFEHRVWPAPPRSLELFQALLDAWRDEAASPTTRHLRVFAGLMELLVELLPPTFRADSSDAGTDLWWDLETKLREDLSRPIDMRLLETLSGRSQRSVIRACHMAVGMPPMKRVKRLRLSYARGLVLYSQLSLTDIALRVGYGRVQELSRDYRQQFEVTPREDRQQGPDYRDYPPKC
ncbi:MAG: AraC family transcriptional regulator [Thermoguttaceae bacterium]|jgi:AraC-like DNA-binding protein